MHQSKYSKPPPTPGRGLPGTWIKKMAKSVTDLAPGDLLKGLSPAHAVEN